MPEPELPVDAARGDARHRDVRAEVFAAVPQRRAPFGKRLFWRVALFVARFPLGVRLMKRLRGS
ncbi:MAG TPA: hypothetical protein VGO61_19560 [Steroidobacteraceae bacterium]|jgi:hypothetical protein|nr:hypothetical protein [Steroidobacteraceae bacterium]